MTFADYTNSSRFPLTTRAELSPLEQFLIDAVNLDHVREYLTRGGTISDALAGSLAELEEKEKAWPELLDWLDEAGRVV